MSRHSNKRGGDQLPKQNDNSLNPKASPFSYTGLEESLPTVDHGSIPTAVSSPPKPIDEKISSLPTLPPNLLLNRANLPGAPTSIPYWSLGSRASPAVPPAPHARHRDPVGPVYNYPLSEAFLSPCQASRVSPQYNHSSSASPSSNVSPLTETENRSFPQYSGGDDICISPLDLHKPPSIGHEDRYRCSRIFPDRAASDSSTTDRDGFRRVSCGWEGCNATFSRKADVNRHIASTHEVKLIDCDVKNCSRKGDNGFVRKDHLQEHKRGYHCMNIPKRQINGTGRF